MTAEQLLLLAHEFCITHRTTVNNYAALVAGASASTARIEGIAIHANAQEAALALEECLRAFPALSGRNQEFAAFCAEVFLHVAQTR
ncbi:cell filamentation protein Fic [Corynebacterium lizhenjunii]|uniref:Cell filamentation protein Fic n=1 Tax=Corynebacterium lizhenjunii TaxID=2709394 RepID=A0A7T0KE84_9CORY|nr:cell filamentation protein Fic [Corynebacterium lizhenjunii]QPK79175.1 cell filamentation protein Fic [Corynebacterium lizhenjunii]